MNLRPYFEKIDRLWSGDRVPDDSECPVPLTWMLRGPADEVEARSAQLAPIDTYWRRCKAERLGPPPPKRQYPLAELYAAIDADPDGRPYPADAELTFGERLALAEYRVERQAQRLTVQQGEES